MVRLVISLISGLFLIGCTPQYLNYSKDVNPLGWRCQDTVLLNHPNDDTLSTKKIALFFRVSAKSDFDTKKIAITIETIAPDSTRFEETYIVYIPGAEAVNSTKNNPFREVIVPYRVGVVLSQAGIYTFRLTPVKDSQKGFFAIGLQIQPT